MTPRTRDFRHAIADILNEASLRGDRYVDVRGSDVHRRVGNYPGDHRMPMCCNAMRSMMTVADVVLKQPPSGKGASLEIRFMLPRRGQSAAA